MNVAGNGVQAATLAAYDLFAVCQHHGAIWGGHYTSLCRHPGPCAVRVLSRYARPRGVCQLPWCVRAALLLWRAGRGWDVAQV